MANHSDIEKFLRLGLAPAAIYTIASGVLTAPSSNILAAVESSTTDDLDTLTIANISDGDMVLVRASDATKTIVLKHNTGNLFNPGGADISLAETTDAALYIYSAADTKFTCISVMTLAAPLTGASYMPLAGGTFSGSTTYNDTKAILFGTPGTDVVLTPDGTDLVESGTGDHVIVDSMDLFIGTGKDTGFKHDGTNTTIDHNTGELILAMGTRALTYDPELGGEIKRQTVDTGAVSLSTGGATTTLGLTIPSGARIISAVGRVNTAITGVSASGVTVAAAFSGGSTLAIGDFITAGDGNAAKNTKVANLFGYATDNKTTGSTDITITISGGVDNTPSAGAVRFLVTYDTVAAIDDAP